MDLIIGAVIGGSLVWFAKDWVRSVLEAAKTWVINR